MAEARKCEATTQNGTRCSRNALIGEKYCTQHLKMYGSQKAKIKELTEEKFSPLRETELIKDLQEIVNAYAYGEFDPVESLKYQKLYPKKYTYAQYLEDFQIYQLQNFEELRDLIISEYPSFVELYNTYINNATYANLEELSGWGYDLINIIIQTFKDKNLDQPIIEVYKSSSGILTANLVNAILKAKVKESDQLYNKNSQFIYFSNSGLKNGRNVSYTEYAHLSYFWQLIYIVMYIVYNHRIPVGI